MQESTAAERLAGLQAVSRRLGRLRTAGEVAEIIVREGAVALGGHTGSLCLLLDDGETMELVHEVGYSREVTEEWRRFPLAARVPAGDAIRSRRPVLLRSLEERDDRYPVFRGSPPSDQAFAILPLFGDDGAPLGVFTVGWPAPRSFSDDDLTFLEVLATQCAQAIERARLYEALQAASERQAFLLEASRALASSLDYGTTLTTLVEHAVPRLADSAAVHVLEDRDLRLVALAHVDPMAEEAMRVLSARTGDVARDPTMLEALATGRSVLSRDIPGEVWERVAEDAEHLRLLRALDARSAMVVPLRVEGRALGTLVLTTTGASARRFSEADLEVVEDLAGRAAVAIDNALAHRARAEMAERLQQSLLPSSDLEIPEIDVAHRYRAMGGDGVGGDFYDVFPLAGGTGQAPTRWGVVIGDVSGKGVEAASLTALVRHTVRALAGVDAEPCAVVRRCSDAVLQAGVGERYATMVFATVEPTGDGAVVELCCGGHPLPVVRSSDGAIRAVGSPGSALGLFEQPDLSAYQLRLAPGDALVLFTDGLLEARSPSGDFAPQLLEHTLRITAGSDALATADAVVAAVDAFEQGHPRDDMAVLVIAVPQPAPAVREVRVQDVPPLLLVRTSEYLDELLRELALVRLGERQGLARNAYPQRLLVLIEDLLTRYAAPRGSTVDQAEAALARGDETTDLVVHLPAAAAVAIEQFLALVEEVQDYAARGSLLTVPAPDEVRHYLRWFVTDVAGQLRGEQPTRFGAGAAIPGSGDRVQAREVRIATVDGENHESGEWRFPLPADLSAAAVARRILRQLGDHLSVDFDTAMLPATELVTNAVLHAGGASLVVVLLPGRVRVEVHDENPEVPSRHSREIDSGTGRGLDLVDASTQRWGVEATAHGKRVWFEQPLEPPFPAPCEPGAAS